MELQIKEQGKIYYADEAAALRRYRATLTQHLWGRVGEVEIGIARQREILFAIDRQGEVCWIRRVR